MSEENKKSEKISPDTTELLEKIATDIHTIMIVVVVALCVAIAVIVLGWVSSCR